MTSDASRERFHRLAKEGIWILVGQIATVVASLVLVRVLTERLDPQQYGRLALGLTVATLVNQVVMCSIAGAVGRYYCIAAERRDLRGYLLTSRHYVLYAALIVLALGLCAVLALLLLGFYAWAGLASVAIFFSILSGFAAALSSIQNAARQRAAVAFHGGLDAWLKILLALVFLLVLPNSATAVVLAYAFSCLVVDGSQFLFVRGFVRAQPSATTTNFPWKTEFWSYLWPIAVTGVFSWMNFSSQRWALDIFVGTRDVGYFYAVTQIGYTPVATAGSLLLNLLTPILFARAGDGEEQARLHGVRRAVLSLSLIGLAFTAVAALVAVVGHAFIFRLLVAAKYQNFSRYLPYAVISAGLFQVSLTLSTVVTVSRNTRRLLYLNTIGNSLIAAANFLFTRMAGIGGLFLAVTLGSAVHLGWMILITRRDLARPGVS